MITLGKRLFGANLVQLLCIILCASLVVVAQNLAVDLSNVSLSTFLSGELNTLFADNASHHLLYNVVLPSIIYLVGGFLFLWMGVINVVTTSYEESKVDQILKISIALFQLGLFMILLFVGGKLFLYSIMFSLIIFVSVMLLKSFIKTEREDP